MAGSKNYPVPKEEGVEIKQVRTTPGGLSTPVEGFESDAGLGKPPVPGCYGAVDDGEIPTSGKVGGGTGRAFDAYFGGKKKP